MTSPQVLIVEDQRALALALAAAVSQAGAETELVATAAQARELLDSGRSWDAMVLDIGLPDENGLEFLAGLEEEQRPPTVVVTAHGEIENTIAARKLGVTDFLTKPLDFDEFQETVTRLIQLRETREDSEEAMPEGGAFVGAASTMRAVFQQIAHSCASDAPVLVRGATGTGKSHAARLIQANSVHQGPVRTLVSGPTTTVEELVDALRAAAGGGLILEEIGMLDAEVQAELVRQIEEVQEGSLRLVATSRDDLRERVGAGEFRSDLFYRLQVLEVRLPELRERMEDLPALVSYFIGQLVPRRSMEITERALQSLSSYQWPGNLRELRNTIAYALTVNTRATAVDVEDLPLYLVNELEKPIAGESPLQLVQALDAWLDERLSAENLPKYRDLSDALEAELIRRLLERYDGKLARLAGALQANRATLRKRLQGAE